MLGAACPAYSSSEEAVITPTKETTAMYGLIGKIKTLPGQRDALISILIAGVSGMPGCLSYVVAQDSTDANAIWITEVWESKESHKASLT